MFNTNLCVELSKDMPEGDVHRHVPLPDEQSCLRSLVVCEQLEHSSKDPYFLDVHGPAAHVISVLEGARKISLLALQLSRRALQAPEV